VREESAVGQILACPKCGGMVMVKAPEGWEPGQPLPPPRVESPAGVTAVVEVKRKDETSSDGDFEDIDAILAGAPPKPKQPVISVAPDAPGLARPRFARTGPLPPGGSAIGKAPPAAAAAGSASSAAASATATAETPPAKPAKAADPAQAADAEGEGMPDFRPPPPPRTWSYYLQYIALAGAIVVGIGLAVAVVAASASFFRGDDKPAAKANPPQVEDSPGRQTTADQSPSPQPIDKKATTPNTAEPTTAAPTTSDVPADTKSPPASAPATPAPQPLPSDANPTPPPPKPSSPFDDLLAPEKDPLAAPEAPPTRPARAPPEPAADEPPPKPLVPRPEPRAVDVPARLADPLSSLETAGTPLVDFLDVMSELSTIPISLAPDGLPLAQASATSPVVLKLPGTTIGGALTAGLKPLGLEHVLADEQLIVRLIEPADLQLLSYPHKDLTGGDETAAAELAELIQAVVDPPSWKLGEGGPAIEVSDALRIKQRRANHAQIFLLCEKLRTARKLPYASRFPPAMFQLDSRTKLASPRLKTPVTINYHQTTPLVKILRELARVANAAAPASRGPGLRVIVDWRDIAAGSWNPDAATSLVVKDESLALALQKLLEPMDLAWRIVDGQTIQVVSPAVLEGRCELELFPAGDLTKSDPSGQELIDGIRETLGEALFRDAGGQGESGGQGELRFDVASQCLVSLLPQPKQQDLEVYLMTLRKPQ
jgi:hypothetical protein